jgi:hypothetical protein
MSAAMVVNPMAQQQRGQMAELHEVKKELSEVKKELNDVKDKILPALATLTEQVRFIGVQSSDIYAGLKIKADKADLSAALVVRDADIARLRLSQEASTATHGNMLDSHDERLRDLEKSNAEIKTLLTNMALTLEKLEKGMSWITGKMWWILGGIAAAGFISEYVLHKK